MGVNNVAEDVLFRIMFEVFPWMAAAVAGLLFFSYVLGPIIEDFVSGRQKGREESRNREAIAKQQHTLAMAEITLRGEFDDWLEAEALRLQIECATHPDERDRAEALAAVETARTANSACIIALHQLDEGASVRPDGLQSVQGQWESLRAKGAGPQTTRS